MDGGMPIPAGELAELFQGFAGRWQIERDIPGLAAFRGEAEFAMTGRPDVLAYAESGILTTLAGHQAPASRRLLYCRMDGRLAIKDDDARRRGALLHLLAFARQTGDAARLAASHRHRCGADSYDLEMRIIDADRFETRYRVTGPRKDYRIDTICRRLADAAATAPPRPKA
jgi:hypothetical protein